MRAPADVHRLTNRKLGNWAYGIAYGRPWGPRGGPTKYQVLGALRPTVRNTVGPTTWFSGSYYINVRVARRVLRRRLAGGETDLISQKVSIKSLCKSQFPHKPVNLSSIITNKEDKLTDLCRN